MLTLSFPESEKEDVDRVFSQRTGLGRFREFETERLN